MLEQLSPAMIWKRLLLIFGIAVANFAAWLWIYATAWSRAMNSGRPSTALENALAAALGFPLVPRLGEATGLVALNSLIWGLVLGLAVPAVWRAAKRGRVAGAN